MAIVTRPDGLLREVNGLLDDSNHKPDGLSAVSIQLHYQGQGDPENNVTAPVSSHYHRLDGGSGTSFYVKETGAGNTGWVAK